MPTCDAALAPDGDGDVLSVACPVPPLRWQAEDLSWPLQAGVRGTGGDQIARVFVLDVSRFGAPWGKQEPLLETLRDG